jgi:hypothetical protein
MPLWSEIQKPMIQIRPNGNTKTKTLYADGPLRFQIPRGYSRYGLSQYKSLSISNLDPKFMEWFQEIEQGLFPKDRNDFKSCVSEYGLRVKVDDSTLIFDSKSKFVADEHVEGYLRDLDISCIIDVEGAYLWKGAWGINCRAHQIKFYDPVPKIPDLDMESETPQPTILKGCAFI